MLSYHIHVSTVTDFCHGPLSVLQKCMVESMQRSSEDVLISFKVSARSCATSALQALRQEACQACVLHAVKCSSADPVP